VKEHIISLPAIRSRQAIYQLAEAPSLYGESPLCDRIIATLENMTPSEQERLDAFLKREGLRGFLTRLNLAEYTA
jgi:hypothetical protein